MKNHKIILAGAFVIAAAPAFAQSGLPNASPTLGDGPRPPDAVTCIHQDSPTGSRLGAKKVCHTETQWREIRAQSALNMSDLQTRSDNQYQKSE